jgi:hypothetical protein
MPRFVTNLVIHFWILVLQFWAFRDKSIIGPYDLGFEVSYVQNDVKIFQQLSCCNIFHLIVIIGSFCGHI